MSLHPGEVICAEDDLPRGADRRVESLRVANVGDRPIQVGSHFHFFEVNAALRFERPAAYGMRLSVPAGSAVRFEPGDERDVDLVPLAGRRVVRGMNGLVEGALDEPAVREAAMRRAEGRGSGDGGPPG
ncbi:MAG: urease subunit beta [Thermoleophilaceae bacterium]